MQERRGGGRVKMDQEEELPRTEHKLNELIKENLNAKLDFQSLGQASSPAFGAYLCSFNISLACQQTSRTTNLSTNVMLTILKNELKIKPEFRHEPQTINTFQMTEPELGKYTYSRSLSLLSSPGLRSLVSCSVCSETLSGLCLPMVSGVCGHAVCRDCLEASSGSSCPVTECDTLVQPRDYTESRTLGQVTECLDNIRSLLQRAAVSRETEAGVSGRTETVPAPSPRRLRGNKENVRKDLRKAVLSEAIQQKIPANKKPKTAKKTDVNKESEKEDKSTEAGDRRRSLPATKKENKTKRVRSVTVENLQASRAGSSKRVVNIEKRNPRGETPLQVACAKGDEDKVKSLLEDGANCNTQDNNGWTPLHDACTGVRTNIVRILLQFGANPSVPGGPERLTPLHDAVTGGDLEIIRLLVTHGADRDAKDSEGRTPRNIAVGLSEETRKVIDETKVITDLNESIKVNAKAKEMLICLSKNIAKNAQVKKLCYDLLPKYNLKKPITEFTSFVSHFVVEENEKLGATSYQYLAALVTGADMVQHNWLLESAQRNKILDADNYVVEFYKEDEEGAARAKELITSQQPKLFAGIHFYLLGQFGAKLNRDQILSLIRLCDGKIVTREPDPEWIPEHEVSIPHHAGADSSLAETSHVLLYQEGGKSEPLLKYNMKHIKTLPLSWMLNSLKYCNLREPGS